MIHTGEDLAVVPEGSDPPEGICEKEAFVVIAKNGDIHIVATNGKIRMQATDIEMIAIGEGGSKGNIRLDATENIGFNSKSFKVNAANSFKIVTQQLGEITANGLLKIYSSVIRGVTDACAVKDSKNGNQPTVIGNK